MRRLVFAFVIRMGQFQCVPTTYFTDIKETYFEMYTKQVACPLAFQPAYQY